jgi:hypothetical protein
MSVRFYKDGDKKQKFEVSYYDGSGGLNTRDKASEVEDSQSPSEINAISNQRGSVGKRFGYDRVSSGEDSGNPQGMVRYVKTGASTEKRLLIFQAGKVFEVTPSDFDWTSIKTGLDADAVVRGITFNNKAVFGNGVDDQQVYDGSTVSAVGNGCPKTNIMGIINTMLLAANGTTVYWGNPELLTFSGDNAGSISVNYQDGEDVTALEEHNDAIMAFKETAKRGLSVVFDDTNIAIGLKESEVADKTGAVSAGAVISGDLGGIYFLSEDGLRSYGIQENYPQQRSSAGLSKHIRSIIRKINPNAYDRISSAEWNDLFLFAAPMGTAQVNDRVIVYSPEFRSFGVWDIPACAFARFEDENGTRNLYFVHSTEPRLCRLNYEYVDDNGGENLPIVFDRTWKHAFPSPRNRWDEMEIEMDITVPNETDIIVSVDGSEWTQTITEADIQEEHDFFEGGYFGGSFVGGAPFGGEETDIYAGPKKYRCTIKRPIDSGINLGAECSVRIRNEKVSQGIDVRKVILRGEPFLFYEV